MSKVEELKLDVEELKQLLEKATRQKVKDILAVEIRKIETEIINRQATSASEVPVARPPTTTSQAPACYDVKLTNYAWDESDKFVKIYVTLKNVHTIPKENIRCVFTSKSMDLVVGGLDGKNHTLLITNLMHPILPDGSHKKIKSDMVVVFMKKDSADKHWGAVTKQEVKTKEPKVPKMDEGEDPSKGLMDMMKQMYDDGDDDMKRTIAKAWTESRDKNEVPKF